MIPDIGWIYDENYLVRQGILSKKDVPSYKRLEKIVHK